MAMGWFDFYQRPKPPGSQELADGFRPWVETCIELFGATHTEPEVKPCSPKSRR